MEAWPLVGRAEELGMVTALLDARTPGTGFVIAGRPGVGKTRLIRRAAADAAGRGYVVRQLAGVAAAQAVPLGVFYPWIGDRSGSSLQMISSLIEAVTSDPQGRPVLVVVDDIHLLDDLSAFAVHQLVLRRAAVVVASLRTGVSVPDAVTALWKDGHLRRLDLQALSRSEITTLIEQVLGGPVAAATIDHLWTLTRGNALFLRQIVTQEYAAGRITHGPDGWRWLGDVTVSDTLDDLVHDQIGDVAESVVDVVDLVALAEPCELDLLRRLADVDSIHEADRRGLITISPNPGGPMVRVGHPLLAEVRLARAGRVHLNSLRGRIARALLTSAPTTSPDPVRLCLLWRASDLPKNPDILAAGAVAAFARLDMDLAHRLAQEAVDAGAGADVELLRGTALILLSRGAEAEQALARLCNLPLAEPIWSTAVLLRAVNLLWPLGEAARTRRVVDDAIAHTSGAARDRIATFRAVQCAVTGRPAAALEICDTIDPRHLTALPAVLEAWARTIASGDLGRPGDATDTATETVPTDATSSETAFFRSVILTLYRVRSLILGGCIRQATAVADDAFRHSGDAPGSAPAFLAGALGAVSLAYGDIARAVELLDTVFTFCADRTDGSRHHFGVEYVRALALSGEVDAAGEALAVVERDHHPAHSYRHAELLIAGAWVAASGGLVSRAQDLAAEAAAEARGRGQHAVELAALQSALQFGTRHLTARLDELVELTDCPRAPLIARWAGELENSRSAALLDVAHELERMGDRIAAADAAAQATLVHRAAGRRGSALTAAAFAERLVADCKATTPATRAAAASVSLSDRQREIAGLVAAGMSNREIADQLGLSVRTVEGHVYRCCVQLGVRSRSELARLRSI